MANVQALAEATRQADFARLPLYYGNEKDTFNAEQWIARIDSVRATANWNDAMTMTTVFNALRGDALQWYDAVRLDVDVTVYDNFKNVFLAAWSKTRTARTTTAILVGLQQMANETVTNFYARVRKGMADIVALEGIPPVPNEALPATLTALNAVQAWAAQNALAGDRDRFNLPAGTTNAVTLNRYLEEVVSFGANYRQDRLGKYLFIAGLKPILRDELMKNPPDGGLYQANEIAHNLEKCLTDPKINKTNAPIEKTIENEIAATQRRGSFRGRMRGRGGYVRGRGQARGGYTTSKANMTCYYCAKKGHFESECHAKMRGEPRVTTNSNSSSTIAPIETQPAPFFTDTVYEENEENDDYIENAALN